MIDADTKRTYDTAIARAASDRERATRRAEDAETERDICRVTLARMYDKYYATFTAAECEQIEVALEWSDREAVTE